MNMEIELQKSLFTELSLGSYTVNDGWYKEANLPLINIGEIQVEDGQAKVNEDWLLLVTVHTWSKGTSSTQLKQMNQFVRDAFENAGISDYRVSAKLIRTVTMKEPQEDGSLIYHGVTQYRMRILKEEI